MKHNQRRSLSINNDLEDIKRIRRTDENGEIIWTYAVI